MLISEDKDGLKYEMYLSVNCKNIKIKDLKLNIKRYMNSKQIFNSINTKETNKKIKIKSDLNLDINKSYIILFYNSKERNCKAVGFIDDKNHKNKFEDRFQNMINDIELLINQ